MKLGLSLKAAAVTALFAGCIVLVKPDLALQMVDSIRLGRASVSLASLTAGQYPVESLDEWDSQAPDFDVQSHTLGGGEMVSVTQPSAAPQSVVAQAPTAAPAQPPVVKPGSAPEQQSIAGRVTDINNQPIAGVTISIDGVVRATTDAKGSYTISGLPRASYTIVPGKRKTVFAPPERRINAGQGSGSQDFQVQPDLGFRPERDGYSFNNPGHAEPDCAAFKRTFAGLDIQCSDGHPQSQYLELFARYQFSFDTGTCTGMAATSLAYFKGILSLPRAVPAYTLSEQEADADIYVFHGRQYSKAVLGRVVQGLTDWNTSDPAKISARVDAIYQQLRLAVQPDNPDPVVLDLLPRPGCDKPGHTVMPYRIDVSDPSRPRVYIYENYYAGDADRYIQFDFSGQVHSFNYWKWDSNDCSALIALPLSAFIDTDGKIPSEHLKHIAFK